jgi:hypothetical protein
VRGCYFDKGGDAPQALPPVDPSLQIAAQAKAQPSIYSPFGTSIYSGDPNVAGDFKRIDTLDPSQQRQFDARNAIAEQMLGRASTQIGQLPEHAFPVPPRTLDRFNRPDTQSQQLVARLKSMSGNRSTPTWTARRCAMRTSRSEEPARPGVPAGAGAARPEAGEHGPADRLGSSGIRPATCSAASAIQAYEQASLDAITGGRRKSRTSSGASSRRASRTSATSPRR